MASRPVAPIQILRTSQARFIAPSLVGRVYSYRLVTSAQAGLPRTLAIVFSGHEILVVRDAGSAMAAVFHRVDLFYSGPDALNLRCKFSLLGA